MVFAISSRAPSLSHIPIHPFCDIPATVGSVPSDRYSVEGGVVGRTHVDSLRSLQ